MKTSSSHKLLSSLTGKASLLTLVLIVTGILFTAPSAIAQQITATTTPPLTPEEQQQQNRLQSTMAATTRNLAQGQKEVNGVVYTPRWSNPVWVGANSLSILFVYCLPGEFADSGQEILGGSQLEVLESYALAVTNDVMVWLMVVENEDENLRLPAAVGVICASDLNDAETRVLSPQEETEINNIIQQFITIRTTQITNITQVINIINNVTTNGTGCQLEITTNEETYESAGDTVTINVTNNGNEALEFPNSVLGLEIENLGTGDIFPLVSAQVITTLEPGESRTFQFTYEELVSEIGTGTIEARVGGDGCLASTTFTLTSETTEPLTVQAVIDIDQDASPVVGFEASIDGGRPPYTCLWDLGDNTTSEECNVSHIYQNLGTYTATVTVTDSVGQTASDSTEEFSITNTGVVTPEPLRAQVNLDSTDIPFTHRFEARAYGGTEPYTYHWDFGDGQEANVQNTRHTYENPGTYTATLTVTDATGQTASDSTEVIVEPAPTNDTGGVEPEPLRIEAELDPLDANTAPASYLFEGRTFGGTEPYTYSWDFGDGQQSDRQDVYHTYENPGTYTVTVTVTDATGQTASDSISPLNIIPAPTEGEPPTTNATAGISATPPPTITTEVQEEPADASVIDGNSTR
jgi:PKD repeat protein